jgi:hypothetical protein
MTSCARIGAIIVWGKLTPAEASVHIAALRSRSRYAPTNESRIRHGLVSYAVYRRGLTRKHVAIGTDLHAAMRRAITECEADGWAIENDGAYAFFFCNRGGERLAVRIQSTDPRQPTPLNNTSPFGPAGNS